MPGLEAAEPAATLPRAPRSCPRGIGRLRGKPVSTEASRSMTKNGPQRFEGTSTYVAPRDLTVAVNAAVTLERPLLVKGEPGTGKSVLAAELARALDAPLIEWHVKSTTKALSWPTPSVKSPASADHKVDSSGRNFSSKSPAISRNC